MSIFAGPSANPVSGIANCPDHTQHCIRSTYCCAAGITGIIDSGGSGQYWHSAQPYLNRKYSTLCWLLKILKIHISILICHNWSYHSHTTLFSRVLFPVAQWSVRLGVFDTCSANTDLPQVGANFLGARAHCALIMMGDPLIWRLLPWQITHHSWMIEKTTIVQV